MRYVGKSPLGVALDREMYDRLHATDYTFPHMTVFIHFSHTTVREGAYTCTHGG
jgi:hypothetical protein